MIPIDIYINNKNIVKGKLCKAMISRGMGLMFSFKILGAVLILKKKRKIVLHNFFVFRKLKACLLNEKNKVEEMIEMHPFGVYKFNKKGNVVVELPKGVKVKKGDKIIWKVRQ